jgi:hypothetical protein
VALSGGLSNPSFKDLLQCLTANASDQERRRPASNRSGWADGRRKFASVSAVVVSVLRQTKSEMRAKDIHTEVERVLGGTVSRYTVSDYLLKRSKGPTPLFTQTRRGYYRLRQLSDGSAS